MCDIYSLLLLYYASQYIYHKNNLMDTQYDPDTNTMTNYHIYKSKMYYDKTVFLKQVRILPLQELMDLIWCYKEPQPGPRFGGMVLM